MMDDDSLIGTVFADAKDKMAKAVTHLQQEFTAIRTGRATPALVEHLKVDYYGTEVPLQQLAGFSVPEARVLVIAPYDKNSLKAIEKAIQNSDLGINPSNDGTVIRLSFPPLTEERRRELAKLAGKYAEQQRIAVRNVRRDVIHHLKEEQSVGADDERRAEERVQKLTDEHVKKIDELLKHKEAEIMEV